MRMKNDMKAFENLAYNDTATRTCMTYPASDLTIMTASGIDELR